MATRQNPLAGFPSGRKFPTGAAARPMPQGDGDGGEDEKGDGTAQSGYVTPDLGPFECENCMHFTAPTTCDHPEVISDPEVQGQVEAEACCNFFKSAHKETQQEEHSEGEATDTGTRIPGEGSGGNTTGYGG